MAGDKVSVYLFLYRIS